MLRLKEEEERKNEKLNLGELIQPKIKINNLEPLFPRFDTERKRLVFETRTLVFVEKIKYKTKTQNQ